ncbi:MAG: flippase-like domain-containing protein [Rhodobacteraceae bacterium]|nr:flippase-like domain-containing protein [Paracoccaceae bacterium]
MQPVLWQGMRFIKSHKDLVFGLSMLALFVIGAGMMVFYTGSEAMLAELGKIGWGQFMLLLVLSLGNYALRALRWHVLASALELKTGFIRNIIHYLGGFALTITPGRVGELVRLRWIKREVGVPMMQTSPMMLADRAADLAGVALVLVVAAGFSFSGGNGVYAVVGVALLMAFLATNPRFMSAIVTTGWRSLGRGGRFFAGLRRAVRRLGLFGRIGVVIPVLALSVVGWLFEAYAFYLLLGWLGADISLGAAVAIFLFSMLGGGATGLPGGLGGTEAAMVVLLSLQNVPLEVALPATAIIRVATLWFAILIGIIVFPLAERGGPKHALEK